MSELELKSVLDTLQIIKEIKSIISPENPYLPVYSALGGAFIGAISAFFPSYLIHKIQERKDKKSTTLQLYSEIKAIIEIADQRNYIRNLEEICEAFDQQKFQSYTYQIQVSDERFPIFKSNLSNLGLLNIDIQVKIVEFYQLVEAVIQDVKPGGILNASPVGIDIFREDLKISRKARQLGTEILELIAKQYKLTRTPSSP